jgi:hypothetical protein
MLLLYTIVLGAVIAGLIYLRSGGRIKSDRMFPENIPQVETKPIIVSEEFIHALEQAGTRPSLVAAIRKENERLRKLNERKP